MVEETEAADGTLTYGWASFRPRCLQFLNTPKWLAFFLCQYFLTQNAIVNGIFPASVSTIERRFGFTSKMLGILISMYDIASLLVSPFVGYLGETKRKGLWCSYGLLVIGLGFFFSLVPHLVVGNYEAGAAKSVEPTLCGLTNLTNATDKGECNDSSSTTNIGLYVVFLLGQALIGVGSAPMVVLAVPFMDENVKSNIVPMYIGCVFAAGIVGVLIGGFLGSVFLSIYVDIGVVTSLTEGDERWVGAWWLGFAIFSAAAVFWSVWMMGFPERFPGTRRNRETLKEDRNESLPGEFPARYVKLSDILRATRHLLTYASYISVTFGICAEQFIISTIGVFLAKLIQLQFQYTASSASILYGVIAGAAAFTGNLSGAYLNKRLKLSCTGTAKMCFIVSVFGLVSTIPLFIRCNDISIAGVGSPYDPNRCGERGSCLVYNNYYLGLAILFICFTCKLVSVISFGLAWLFCRRQFKRTGTEVIQEAGAELNLS